MNDTRLIRDLDPEARNLEGYLYRTRTASPEHVPPEVVETLVKDSGRPGTRRAPAAPSAFLSPQRS